MFSIRYIWIIVFVICQFSFVNASPEQYDPKAIVMECVKRHGGQDKFEEIRSIYAEMTVRTKSSEKSDIESTFKEYFRQPDKLRIEVYPMFDPPTKISWDGKQAWHLIKGQLEKTEEPKISERLQESLRLLRLLLLTSLFEEGSQLTYVTYFEQQAVHVISRTSAKGDKIRLYIGSNYILLGAEFYWTGTEDLFIVKFYNHEKREEFYLLPTYTELFKKEPGKEKRMVMTVQINEVKINALRNGNSFFTNLNEQPQLKKK